MKETDNEKIIEYLKKHLSSARFNHTLGTWRTARAIAAKHDVSTVKVDLAALLHDIGKGLTKKQLIKYVIKAKIPVPNLQDIIKYNPWVLHGFASADIAKNKFGIKDKDVLKAITQHTIGGAKMSLLSKIIYLADITSPDRRYAGVNKIKWYIKRDLDKAMQTAFFYKLHHVLLNKKWLHPTALEAWNGLIAKNE